MCSGSGRMSAEVLPSARYTVGSRPPAPRRTFKTHWALHCEREWHRAFHMFIIGAHPDLAAQQLCVADLLRAQPSSRASWHSNCRRMSPTQVWL